MDEQAIHDAVARHVAATRFPFPNQQDWPATYETVVNAGNLVRPVATAAGDAHPDIVIVDDGGVPRELGEVETEVVARTAAKWRAYSAALPVNPDTGVRQFVVYVPSGQEEAARSLLEANGISYAGARAYEMEADSRVRIVPYVTPGAPQDHR